MKQPLVTVFIALYNAEKYLYDTLNSVVNQTYENIEILIVDDGSNDESVKLVETYSDSRIRLIKNKENQGIPFTRNIGLEAANGKYLAVLDADDIACLTRIEKQVEYLEANSHVDVLGSNYEIIGKRFRRIVKRKYITSEEIKIQLLFGSPIANPTAMIRMEIIKKENIKYNSAYFVAQDYDLWVQLSDRSEFAIIPDVLVKYRVGHSNISEKSRKNKSVERKKIIDEIHNSVLKKYKIKLNKKELELYNNLFSDNPLENNNQNNQGIIKLIVKLVENNKIHKVFDQKTFLKVLVYSCIRAISNQDINLSSKISLCKNLFNIIEEPKRLSNYMYITLKHWYRRILQIEY